LSYADIFLFVVTVTIECKFYYICFARPVWGDSIFWFVPSFVRSSVSRSLVR